MPKFWDRVEHQDRPRWAAGLEKTLGDLGPGAWREGLQLAPQVLGLSLETPPAPRPVLCLLEHRVAGGTMKCSKGPSK